MAARAHKYHLVAPQIAETNALKFRHFLGVTHVVDVAAQILVARKRPSIQLRRLMDPLNRCVQLSVLSSFFRFQ